MRADAKQLIAVNTPDNRLEIFNIGKHGKLQAAGSVPVGLEPVAVAIHPNGQAWVVNHLSDSVSVVDLNSQPPKVVRTLLVGDEPRDIVFAGENKDRAFITTAHRGQHRTDPSLEGVPGAGDPQLSSPSVPRADVWVFDTNDTGNTFGGTPLKIVELFGDTPRALAVSPDGHYVYAAVFHSGNQTTAIHEAVMCNGFTDDRQGQTPCMVADGISSPAGLPYAELPGGRPGPGTNAYGQPQPWTSLIVQYDQESGEWRDEQGRNFSNAVRFNLPDHDVFAIDSTTLESVAQFDHVGTVLFNMAVNPVNGNIYVSNTEANNATRFEGDGNLTWSTVQGSFAKAQITVINPNNDSVTPRHLNRHINYDKLKQRKGTRNHSLATPLEMAVTSDGKWLYATAYGSSRIGVFRTHELENNALWDGKKREFNPRRISRRYIDVSGGGPAGIILNEQQGVAYVATRFDNGISTIDLIQNREREHLQMFNPEPDSVIAGRPVLYDARTTSSNGEASCAGCHVFGDQDSLAWDLGNPDMPNTETPLDIKLEHTFEWDCLYNGFEDPGCQFSLIVNGDGELRTLASMKGPMTTQTLKGLSNSGHMHWRGDRANGYFGSHTEGDYDEKTSFKNFIVAFEGLNGMKVKLPDDVKARKKGAKVRQLEQDVDRFADFMLQVALPPNPIRNLDNTLSPLAQVGADFFDGPRRSDGLAEDISGQGQDGFTCEGCHRVDPAKGFFGTDGDAAYTLEVQLTKTPHLRNAYTKVGMFGLPDREGFMESHTKEHQGDQIRGFGVLHDGATDTFLNFLKGSVFDNGQQRGGFDIGQGEGHVGIPDMQVRRGLEQYMFEFESDLAPIVGQQLTIDSTPRTGELERLQLLEQRAATPFTSKILGGEVTECDLVASAAVEGYNRGWLYDPSSQTYQSDSVLEQGLSRSQMLQLARTGGQAVTFTCTPPGSGQRIALDRNMNAVFDGDEYY